MLRTRLDGFPVDAQLPRVAGLDGEQRPRDVRPAGSDESREAENLAMTDGESDVGKHAAATPAAHFECRLANHQALASRIVNMPADHHFDKPVLGHGADRFGRDLAPITKHGDAIADLKDLVETVRNEQNGGPALDQPADDRKQRADLLIGQRRGRLVQNENLDVFRQRLGDLHQLPLASGQRGHAGFRIDPDVHPVEQRLHAGAHRRKIDNGPASPPRLPAGVDVLDDADIREHHEMLIDDADGAGALHARSLHRPAANKQPSAIFPFQAGYDFHQRRLARPVLPQKAVNLARKQFEAHVLQRTGRAIGFREARCAQQDGGRNARADRMVGFAPCRAHPGRP